MESHPQESPWRRSADTFTLTVQQGTGRWKPWRGTMTHGIFHVGESGGGIWRAWTRPRLLADMAAFAGRMGIESGQDRVIIVVKGEA